MSAGSRSIAFATPRSSPTPCESSTLTAYTDAEGATCRIRPGDERAVARLRVAVAVAVGVPHVGAVGRGLDGALEPLVLEHARVEHGDPHALAVAGLRRALRKRRGRCRRPHRRARAALDARLAREVDRRRLADEDMVRRHAGRTLRAIGGGAADLGIASSTSRAGSRGFRRHARTASRRRAPARSASSPSAPARRRSRRRAGQDLAGPQQERVLRVVVDRDRTRVPLLGQFARRSGRGVIASAATRRERSHRHAFSSSRGAANRTGLGK